MRTIWILALIATGCGAPTEPCACPPGFLCLPDGCAAVCATNDDCDLAEACINGLCRESTPGPLGHAPGDPAPGDPAPGDPAPGDPAPGDPTPPPPDPDTNAGVCLAGTDQTPDSWPDDQAGDQGLVYDPTMSFEAESGACCGDDPDEWHLWQQGIPAVRACCDRETDCVDNDGSCYDSNTLEVVSTASGTEAQVCYSNWWYACNDVTLCLAHDREERLADLDFDCYFDNGAFVFGDYAAPPLEQCADGQDNDCDGDVDQDDDDCCGHVGQPSCAGWCEPPLEPCLEHGDRCLPVDVCLLPHHPEEWE